MVAELTAEAHPPARRDPRFGCICVICILHEEADFPGVGAAHSSASGELMDVIMVVASDKSGMSVANSLVPFSPRRIQKLCDNGMAGLWGSQS
jgi:hypothetical protein